MRLWSRRIARGFFPPRSSNRSSSVMVVPMPSSIRPNVLTLRRRWRQSAGVAMTAAQGGDGCRRDSRMRLPLYCLAISRYQMQPKRGCVVLRYRADGSRAFSINHTSDFCSMTLTIMTFPSGLKLAPSTLGNIAGQRCQCGNLRSERRPEPWTNLSSRVCSVLPDRVKVFSIRRPAGRIKDANRQERFGIRFQGNNPDAPAPTF